jgi:transcriptional regulator with XRE-family HTH domain
VVCDRLRTLREGKKLSQGDIEKRTGLLRCYISRVENGHTVPTVETLEKMARALEVPLYRLFRRDCLGKFGQGSSVLVEFATAVGACRREGQKAAAVFGSKARDEAQQTEVHRRLKISHGVS